MLKINQSAGFFKNHKKKFSTKRDFRAKIVILSSVLAIFLALAGGCSSKNDNKVADIPETALESIIPSEETIEDAPELAEIEKFSILIDNIVIENLRMTDNLSQKSQATDQAAKKANQAMNTGVTVYDSSDVYQENGTAWESKEDADKYNNASASTVAVGNGYIAPDGSVWTSEEEYKKYINGSNEETVIGDDDTNYGQTPTKAGYYDGLYYTGSIEYGGTNQWFSSKEAYEEYLRGDAANDNEFDDTNYEQTPTTAGYYNGLYYTGSIEYGGTNQWFSSKEAYEEYLREDTANDNEFDNTNYEQTPTKAGYYNGLYYTGSIEYGGTNQWFSSKEAYEESLNQNTINNASSDNTTADEIAPTTAGYYNGLYYTGSVEYGGTDEWFSSKEAYEKTLNQNTINNASSDNTTADEIAPTAAGYYDGLYYTGSVEYGGTDEWFSSKEEYEKTLNQNAVQTTYANEENETNDCIDASEENEEANDYTYIDDGYIDNNTGQFTDKDGNVWANHQDYSIYMQGLQVEANQR